MVGQNEADLLRLQVRLEDDLSKDLEVVIALDKIRSGAKSRKRGVTE